MVNEEKFSRPVLIPESTQKPNFFVPAEFKDKVSLHIIKNYMPDLNPPLFLAIQGPKGDGKSSQTREVCSQMGVYVVPFSGASLSGSHEKDAVNELADVYIYTSSVRETTKMPTILLIDDFDLSVASIFMNREYTVNTQLLTGFLMNLADEPTKCGDKYTYRVPLILTGNDFTGLHGPLVRPGRMDFFDWNPTLDQKIEIVSAMYGESLPSNNDNNESYEVMTVQRNSRRDVGLYRSYEMGAQMQVTNKNTIKTLVGEFADQPISFFASLKSDFVDKIILATVKHEAGVNMMSISQAVTGAYSTITVESLFKLAYQRKAMGAKNYEIPKGEKEDDERWE